MPRIDWSWVLQGALALEDALSKGLPIQKEIDALRTYLEGIEKDSVLDFVLSSLPEETRYRGTDTLLELNQKASCFIVLKVYVSELVSSRMIKLHLLQSRVEVWTWVECLVT